MRHNDENGSEMAPKHPRSKVLTPKEEAICVAFRKHTLLPLDDCLYSLQPTIPHLTRSSLHRLFQRHEISRLLDVAGDQRKQKKKFNAYSIGNFHIDLAVVRTEEGKLYLFVAIDRTSKLAYAELHECQTKTIAVEFLGNLVALVPHKIHMILTDNGIQFTYRKKDGCPLHIFLMVFMKNTALIIAGPKSTILGRMGKWNGRTEPSRMPRSKNTTAVHS